MKQTIFIKTYGCSHNIADSETMAHILSMGDYHVMGINPLLCEDINDADLIIYNTCTVKNPTEDKFFSTLAKQNKKVVICGCIPQADMKNPSLQPFSLLGIDRTSDVMEIVDQTLKGEIVHMLERKSDGGARDFLPMIHKNNLIAIIPILQGCLGNCTYCKTKQARGHLKSFNMGLIIAQIKKAIVSNTKEIWLVSQDNGAYGIDIGSSLPELLREIAKIQGNVKIRIGMLNPNFAYEYRHELVDIMQNDIFYKFLHIPAQSGSDDILVEMKRKYSIAEFNEAIGIISKGVPGITISTDIICGFPGETEDDFEKTISLVKKWKFPVINISKFYPRRGTVAAKMKLLPTEIGKARSTQLALLRSELDAQSCWMEWRGPVLFCEKGKGESFIGRNFAYKPIMVESSEDLLGMITNVKIISRTRDYLIGKVIEN